jgi:hypothetical protein
MQWATATEERVIHVAQHLRSEDRLEVLASHGLDGEACVMDSWRSSAVVRCICLDDKTPVAVCGVVKAEHGGVIWMLGTDRLFETAANTRQFIRGGRIWVNGLMKDWGQLHNWVYNKNQRTKVWLGSLGFTIHPASPMGPFSELFCYVERRA